MCNKNSVVLLVLLSLILVSEISAKVLKSKRNEMFELSFTSSKKYYNPIADVKLYCKFTAPSKKTYQIRGYYDHDSTWKVRFACDEIGEWRYSIICSDNTNKGLNNITGGVDIDEYFGDNPFKINGYPKVSPDKDYLTYGNGEPLFILNDIGWSIPLKSTTEEFEEYLKFRKAQGYNSISIVILDCFISKTGITNRYGVNSFFDSDWGKINPRFFDYMDTVVKKADEYNMLLMIVPIWSCAAEANKHPEYEPYFLTDEQVLRYEEYCTARYAGSNVVWIVTGDSRYENHSFFLWDNVGRVVKEVTGGRQLVTIHSSGATGSFFFYKDTTAWLDFHIYQSGHLFDNQLAWLLMKDYFYTGGKKPVIDLEPSFEDIFPGFRDSMSINKRIDSYQIRRSRYNNILTGAKIGLSYGANGIFQWYTANDKSNWYHSRTYVDSLVYLPGAQALANIYKYFADNDWYKLIPSDAHIFNNGGVNFIPVSRVDSVFYFYIPRGDVKFVFSYPYTDNFTQEWLDPVDLKPKGNFNLCKFDSLNYDIKISKPDTNDWLLRIKFIEKTPSLVNEQASIYNETNFDICKVRIYNLLGIEIESKVFNSYPAVIEEYQKFRHPSVTFHVFTYYKLGKSKTIIMKKIP